MRSLIVIYEQFEVVTVPFPFTDSSATKRRPALVLSSAAAFNTFVGRSVGNDYDCNSFPLGAGRFH
jgi:mRNA interferase MazF